MKKRFIIALFLLMACLAGAQPSLKYTQAFERCHGLWPLQDEFQRVMRDTSTTQAQMDTLAERLLRHPDLHPEDLSDCHFLLGELYRKVLPTHLRDSQKALEYYEKSLREASADNPSFLATLHIRIATAYDHMYGYPSMYSTLHHMSEAARLDASATAMLGDYALFGWGIQQDLYLAAQCYIIGIHHGSRECNANLQYLFYLINEELNGRQDTLAETYMEHAVYQIVVKLDWDSASYWLYKAADRDFVPAIYEIGLAKLNGIIPCVTRGCRDDAWSWIEKAAMKNYPPALYDLAKHSKDIELMQHAAEMGYPDAMVEMGRYYSNDKTDRFVQHHDPERAAYWFLLATKFANNVPLESYDSIVQAERWDYAKETAISQRAKRHYNMLNENRLKLIELIRRSPIYGEPRYRNTSYNRHKAIDRAHGGRELTMAMVHSYETLYQLMGHEAGRYMSLPGGYEKHDVETLLDEMRFLRQRANKLMPNAFPADPMESMKP